MGMYGGGEQAPQNTTSTNTTQVQYSPVEQAARDHIMQSAMNTYDQSAGANVQYPGARPVGPGQTTQQAQNMTLQNASNIGNMATQGQQANEFGMHDVLYADSNPYLQDAMTAATRPLIDQFSESGGALQGTRDHALATGGYGGSRQGIAEGLASKALINKVGDIRSTMSSDAYNKGLDVYQNSIKNLPMLSMMQQMPGQMVGAVGAQQDAAAQMQENSRADQVNWNQNHQWAPLQNLANIIYGGSNGSTTSTATQQAPKQDTSMQTAGTLGSLAMMAAMLLL